MSDSSAAPPTTDELLPRILPMAMREISSVVAESVVFGVYLVMFPVALHNLLKRNRQGATLVIAVVMVMMFTISAFLWASDVVVLVQHFDVIFGRTDPPDILSRIYLSNDVTAKMSYMNDVMFVILFIIGDAVITWRILVLYDWRLWTVAVMASLWLGSCVTGFTLIGCIVHSGFPGNDDVPRLCTVMENTSWTISLALNGLATVLLARIAWSYRKVNKMIEGGRRGSKVDRVLTTLVVSGSIYFILGLPRLTSFAEPSLAPKLTNVTYATEIIEAILYQLVGLYPTAVTAFLFHESKVFANSTVATGVGAGSTVPRFNRAQAASDLTYKPYSSTGATNYSRTVVVTGGSKQALSEDQTSFEKA